MSVTLDAGQAHELVQRLAQVEDWLLHADEHVLDALAAFAFPGCPRPRQAVTFLIEDLGGHGVALSRQLCADHPRPSTPPGARDE